MDGPGSATLRSRRSHPSCVGQLTATVDPSGLRAGRAMDAMFPSISVRGSVESPERTTTRSRPPPFHR